MREWRELRPQREQAVARGLGPGTRGTVALTWNKMGGLGRVSNREIM